MRLAYLTAGAGGMYCGSCLHDNRLAATLIAQGRDVVLIPLYTPPRTDEPVASCGRIYFGGINVYLQQMAGLFRRTPWLVDRVLDTRLLLGLAARFASATQPESLGPLTISMLLAERGLQRKELAKLIAGLRMIEPDLIYLPNLMFVGFATQLKAALGLPVLCGLVGEDIFLDRLPEPHRTHAFDLIRQHSPHVDGFIALSAYYAKHATEHFGLPPDRIHRVPMGIHAGDFWPRPGHGAPPARATPTGDDSPARGTIGYLARLCPEKGVAELCRAFVALRRDGHVCRLRVAGYLGRADRPYWTSTFDELRRTGAHDAVDHVGEVDRQGKVDFLHSLDVLAVPTTYREAKGFYMLEALAAGVPVVLPAHGSFPELIEATGGGLLHAPGDVNGLAETLVRLLRDHELRRALGERGRAAVHATFTAQRMAEEAWQVFRRFA